jgi:HSP20 family protein
MSLIKWNRNKGLIPSFSAMVEDFFKDDDGFFPTLKNDFTLPAVNVADLDDRWQLEAAVPGMEKSDFDIKVEKGVLKISAKKESKFEEKEENYTRQEFNYASFSRSFWLPENVKEDLIEANYDEGILRITIPKKEISVKKEPKVVKVS